MIFYFFIKEKKPLDFPLPHSLPAVASYTTALILEVEVLIPSQGFAEMAFSTEKVNE